MTAGGPKNVPASVRQQLLTLAKSRGEEPEYVPVRYGIERLLYRLSVRSARSRRTAACGRR